MHNPNTCRNNSCLSNPHMEETVIMNHDYFILDPNADIQRLSSREAEDHSDCDHQYFVLEPEGSGS